MKSCSNNHKSPFIESIDSIDKVYLLKRTNSGYYPIKSYSYESSKEILRLIKKDINIEFQHKLKTDYRFKLYQKDSLIGDIDISTEQKPFANFTNSEERFGFRLNESLKKIVEEDSNGIFINVLDTSEFSNYSFFNTYHFINFDSISVSEFVRLLPLRKIAPKQINIITTVGRADINWIRKNDIKRIIKLVNSEQPAYCIVRALSSRLPIKEESTVGGQVMNIIDSYRNKEQYPSFLTNCSKTDKERQQEILKWWEEYK